MKALSTAGGAFIFVTAMNAAQGMQQPYSPTMQPQYPYIPQGMPYGQPAQPYGQQGMPYGQPGMQPGMQPYQQQPMERERMAQIMQLEQQHRMAFFNNNPRASEQDWQIYWNNFRRMNNLG